MKRKGILAVGLLLLGLGLSQVGPFRARVEAAIKSGGEEFARVMLSQDKAQALCTQYRDKLPADLIPTFLAEQRALIKYPARRQAHGGLEERGRRSSPTPSGATATPATRGWRRRWPTAPWGRASSTTGTGGQSEAVVRYTYEKIYNAWAFVPCSLMYRGGVHGLFTPEETADLVAFLLDPESPINRR
jgi:sulfur-oxidizing protein SoxX